MDRKIRVTILNLHCFLIVLNFAGQIKLMDQNGKQWPIIDITSHKPGQFFFGSSMKMAPHPSFSVG